MSDDGSSEATIKDVFEQLVKTKNKKLFKDGSLEATKEDIFEQILNFTISNKYTEMKDRLNALGVISIQGD